MKGPCLLKASPLWSLIYDRDPYEGFPLGTYPPDLQGWGSRHPVFDYLIGTVKPKLIAEVGTWKGGSAINMARSLRERDMDANIICIDTWLGAPEHITNREYFASLGMQHGYPTLFHTFMANVISEDCQDIVVPLPQTSANAAILLRKWGLTADLIYIDGAHHYSAVLQDLEAYWPILASRGVLFGDDYPKAGGVVRATHEFAQARGLDLLVSPGKFVVCRPGDHLGLDKLGFTQAQL